LGTSTILRSALPIPMSSFDDHYRFVNGAGGEIADEPGNRFSYLNVGYATLQDIVQRVSKMRLDEYVEKNILKPLEMERSTYSNERYEEDPDSMTSYIPGEDGEPTPSKPVIHELLFGRGGLLCPVTELTNYLTANIDKGRYKDVELVSSELMEKMHTIQIETPRGWHSKQGYGYGWSVVKDFLGQKLVMHSGSIMVSGGYLAFMPEMKVGVAMGFNMLRFPSAIIAQGLFATMLGKDPEKVIPVLGIRKRLRMLTGKYETYRGVSKARVAYREGLLYFEQETRDGKTSIPLIPEDEKVETYDFYAYSDGTKTPFRFDVHSPEKLDLDLGRVKFHKVSC
jgi:CubicO group peptidase (beta-lactamase class C family)